jgi:hypothetical protein
MGETSNILDAALMYAKLGWPVLPLRFDRSSGVLKKVPLLRDWPNKASTKKDDVLDWFAPGSRNVYLYREALGIGVVTGKRSNLIVVDIDPRNGGEESLVLLGLELPETLTVKTPQGGRHYYYACEETFRGFVLADGIDIKGDGGFVVAPPSQGYEVVKNRFAA